MNASIPATTIDPKEAAHFGQLAADWWDPKGSSAMLHRLNPVRLRFIREMTDDHWSIDPHERKPLAGKRVLDVGCGAGLLSEPLARLGAEVTGLDAAEENVAAARVHAEKQGLTIAYRAGEIGSIGVSRFDLITCMEVIEHVIDPALFVRGLTDRLAPGGLLLLSTPNRTSKSRLMMITIGEGLGQIPKGTHDWTKFLTPEELATLLTEADARVIAQRGLSYRPDHGFRLSDDLSLNYFMAAVRK
jgi:2-polyprenyl-6-hydroxyphenyl methylase/3-demethylubiquinone-9 3-methyltransferase